MASNDNDVLKILLVEGREAIRKAFLDQCERERENFEAILRKHFAERGRIIEQLLDEREALYRKLDKMAGRLAHLEEEIGVPGDGEMHWPN